MWGAFKSASTLLAVCRSNARSAQFILPPARSYNGTSTFGMTRLESSRARADHQQQIWRFKSRSLLRVQLANGNKAGVASNRCLGARGVDADRIDPACMKRRPFAPLHIMDASESSRLLRLPRRLAQNKSESRGKVKLECKKPSDSPSFSK